MYKKIASLVMTGLLIFSAAACSSTTATETEDADTEVSEAATASEATIIGQVTEIDGDTITLALGTFEMPEDMSMPDGQAGDEAMPEGRAPADGTMPEGGAPADGTMPDDAAPAENATEGETADDTAEAASDAELPDGDSEAPAMPSGDFELPEDVEGGSAPDIDGAPNGGGMGGGSFGFTATGETQTITVTSDTVIILGSSDDAETGSVSDISVDDYVTVTLSDSTVTEIVVTQLAMGGGDMGGEAPDGAPGKRRRHDRFSEHRERGF